MRTSPRPSRAQAAEEAFQWLARLERTLRPGESDALREWLKVPLHRELIIERCRLMHAPEVLAVLSKLVPVTPPKPTYIQRYARSRVAIATTAVVLTLLTMQLTGRAPWQGDSSPAHLARHVEMYVTEPGETRDIQLPDGSTVTLGPTSQLFVRYGYNYRDLALMAGAATFDVRQDPSRLVRLNAAGRILLPAGTVNRFNVQQLSEDRAELTVMEGQVRLLRTRVREPSTPAHLRLPRSYGEATLYPMEAAIVGQGWQVIGKVESRQREPGAQTIYHLPGSVFSAKCRNDSGTNASSVASRTASLI